MVIVTGGAGFIGSNIIKALNNIGITDILVVDNLKNGTKFINLSNLKISDYLDKEDYLIQIKSNQKPKKKIDAIFHEGACSSTIEWDGKYIMNNNYQYSKELLNFCLNKKIPFFYASSSAIYGSNTSDFREFTENQNPLNIYGYSKYLFDKYVRYMLPKANSQIVGLRYFNVYGPNEQHKGNMASIIYRLNTQIKKGENLKIFKGSENFKRDFVYIDDITSVNLWFFKKNISGIFNVGSGYATSFKEVANIILNYHKKENNIEYITFPEDLKSFYQIFTQADLTNLRSAGYDKSFKNIYEGIKEYITLLG